MTLDDLTVNFRHVDRRALLADWRWLIGTQKLPILLTAGGDAFLQDTEDDSIHFLDVGAGDLRQVAQTPEQFNGLLADRDFVVNHFAVEMISDLKRNGRTLEQGKIFSFKKPPVLGGDYVLANIEPTDIEVHFSLNGQIHEKASKLPPGTKVKGVTIK
jgi:hypothetical protein